MTPTNNFVGHAEDVCETHRFQSPIRFDRFMFYLTVNIKVSVLKPEAWLGLEWGRAMRREPLWM